MPHIISTSITKVNENEISRNEGDKGLLSLNRF
jgi:hypothetical protein